MGYGKHSLALGESHFQHLISTPPLETKFIELLDMLGAQRPEALGATLVHDHKTQRFVLGPLSCDPSAQGAYSQASQTEQSSRRSAA